MPSIVIFVCGLDNWLLRLTASSFCLQSNNKHAFDIIITLSCDIDHLPFFLLNFYFRENIFNDVVFVELSTDSKHIGYSSGNLRR